MTGLSMAQISSLSCRERRPSVFLPHHPEQIARHLVAHPSADYRGQAAVVWAAARGESFSSFPGLGIAPARG
jgi:hypothetical protein